MKENPIQTGWLKKKQNKNLWVLLKGKHSGRVSLQEIQGLRHHRNSVFLPLPLEYLIPRLEKREQLFPGYSRKKYPRITFEWSTLGHMTTFKTISLAGIKIQYCVDLYHFPTLRSGERGGRGTASPHELKVQGKGKIVSSEETRNVPVSYTHLTLPTIVEWCRSRWSPYH